MRLLIFLTTLSVALASNRKDPFFRKDYKYFYDFDAFYKFHGATADATWLNAFLTCSDEGSKLFYPKTQDEFTVAKELTAKVDGLNATHIFVGIHDEFNIGEYITVDGSSAPLSIVNSLNEFNRRNQRQCVLLDLVKGTYSLDSCVLPSGEERPFICKKDTPPTPCPTIDTDYIYEKQTEKCYKVNNRRKTWDEAFRTCYMEGASLLVIRDAEETTIIRDHITRYSLEWRANDENKKYFTGIRTMDRDGNYFTIKDWSLNGGPAWHNDDLDFESIMCVIFSPDARFTYYSEEPCYNKFRFICEMDAKQRKY